MGKRCRFCDDFWCNRGIYGLGTELWPSNEGQYDDTSRSGSIQPQEIPRGHSVLRELVRTTSLQTQANVFGYVWNFSKGPITMEADTLLLGWNPRMWDAGGRNAGTVAISRGLVDGDGLSPAFLHTENALGTPTADRFFTLDLGVAVPIDSVSFYPPQSGLAEDGFALHQMYLRLVDESKGQC